jgi:uncharacterized protein (DUF2237 family)
MDFKKKYLKYKTKYFTLENNYLTYNIDGPIENFSQVGGINTLNILGTKLVPCCKDSCITTGYDRKGLCSTSKADTGTHVVCAIVDDEFLKFTKTKGNDLITPIPGLFPGLVAGDSWCLCILRWIEAYNAGVAPKIIAESTNAIAANYIDKNVLLKYQYST